MMRRVSHLVLAAAMGVTMSSLYVADAQAQALSFFLNRAMEKNPSLSRQQAIVDQQTADIDVARAGFRPTVTVTGDIGAIMADSDIAARDDDTVPMGAALTATQSLYRGGRTTAQVAASEARFAQQELLLATREQQVMFDVTEAYLDVVRDRQVLVLNETNVKRLDEQLRAEREKFKLGASTRTDVAQAEARFARAKADRSAALSRVRTSQNRLGELTDFPDVKQDLSKIVPPTKLRALKIPSDIKNVLEMAAKQNPQLVAAGKGLKASGQDVEVAYGAYLPEVSLVGQLAHDDSDLGDSDDRTNQASAVVSMTVPLYSAGVTSAQHDRAIAAERASAASLRDTRLSIDAAVRTAWEQLTARKSERDANKEQVRAAALALVGTREEAKLGTRSTLDILDAEQEKLDAEVDLVRVQRDVLVSQLTLLRLMGQLSAKTLLAL